MGGNNLRLPGRYTLPGNGKCEGNRIKPRGGRFDLFSHFRILEETQPGLNLYWLKNIAINFLPFDLSFVFSKFATDCIVPGGTARPLSQTRTPQ